MKKTKFVKFKLINDGFKGIGISYLEYKTKDGIITAIPVEKSPPSPIPDKLKNEINILKEHFLTLTRHIKEPKETKANKFILNDTFITGVSEALNGYVITGKIESYDNKIFGLATILVGEESEYPYYEDLHEKMTLVKELVMSHLEKLEMQKPKQYLLQFAKDDDAKDVINDMTDEKREETMIKKLEQTGKFTVLNNVEVTEGIEGEKLETEMHVVDSKKEKGLPSVKESAYAKQVTG